MSSGIIDKNRVYLNRRSIRLKGYDYSQTGAYFITICTYNRGNMFGEIIDDKMSLNKYGETAHVCWMEIPDHFPNVELDEYVIMPNHVHGIIMIANSRGTAYRAPTSTCRAPTINQSNTRIIEQFGKPVAGSIPTIVRSFKSGITKNINVLRKTPSVPVWQRNYYEHIIRDNDELNRIREYIINNPAEWNEDEYNVCKDRIS